MKLSYTKVVSCYSQWFCKGFTLIELLVAIMIIGILAAVAVSQYQKAVMKSRFAAMMPIAKTLANANEVYYAEHDEYSTDPAKLNVTPQAGTPDGTAINMYSNPEEVSFVRVENPGVPNARYVVYQKLSENFPETTWCEAGDTRTEELCVALGGTLPAGVTGNSSGDNTNYKAYLLTGQARSGDKFAEPVCLGAVCDENGNITECNSGETLNNGECVVCDIPNATECSTTAYTATACGTGYTLNNGSCEACATAFPNATACSATSYAPTACSEGYVLNGNACEVDPNYAKLQARAASLCPTDQSQYVCTIKNGYVYQCDTNSGTIDEAIDECVSNGTSSGYYETIYDADGIKQQQYGCQHVDSGHCYAGYFHDYAAGTGKYRMCADNVAISKDATCANGYANEGRDYTYDSHGLTIDSNPCSAVNEKGVCTVYSEMYYSDRTYDGNTQTGYVSSKCASISGTTCVGNNYKNIKATKNNGTSTTEVGCVSSDSNVVGLISMDGTCNSGYRIKQKTVVNGTTTFKNCSNYNSINWENATCS